MISKELLSEVLEISIDSISECNGDQGNLIIYYQRLSDKSSSINIYELAHKCKEWARNNGYLIYSVPDLAFVKTLSLEYCVDFGDKSEIENVFRSCQWILDALEQRMIIKNKGCKND